MIIIKELVVKHSSTSWEGISQPLLCSMGHHGQRRLNYNNEGEPLTN